MWQLSEGVPGAVSQAAGEEKGRKGHLWVHVPVLCCGSAATGVASDPDSDLGVPESILGRLRCDQGACETGRAGFCGLNAG